MFAKNKFFEIFKKKQQKLNKRKKIAKVKAKKRNKRRKRSKKKLGIKTLLILGFSFCIVFILFIFSWFFLLKDLPSPKNLSEGEIAVSTEIYDRNGTLLYEIFADENRTPIELEIVPDTVKLATVAIEDKDFYKHSGFAIRGIARALWKNLKSDELQGGSTITQQLVKSALLTPEQTIERKIKEIILSTIAEFMYSKDEILEMYLNQIPYGGTAYGIEQASKLYFDKSVGELNLAESALLAGLPQAPSKYSPYGAHPELAKQRQEQVLNSMFEEGYISEKERDEAKNSVLSYASKNIDIKAPHFVFYVKDQLIEKYGEEMVETGGLRVKTSLDLPLQEYVQASVSAEVASLEYANVTNGAVLVTKPATGEILTMVGSKNYFDEEYDGNVNLTTALRQPGSSIKPLNYALGLENGYTASMIFLDIPTCFTAPGQAGAYCPKNYDGGYHGIPTMRASLANSYNVPAVKMIALNGVENFINKATEMGISTWKDPSRYGLSLTLGGGEVYMTDMAVAFGVFANSGIKIGLNPILEVKNYKEEVLEEYDHENQPPAGERALSAETSFIISDILSDNNARMPAFGAYSKLMIPNKSVSVKTGTTDDLRDNWTIGYTPEYLTAVWVGNNDNSKMNNWIASGVTGASPIWHSVMSHILEDEPDAILAKPETVVGMHVCEYKNEASEDCQGRYEYFTRGTETNPLHGKIEQKDVWIDKATQRPPLFGQSQDGLDLELQNKRMASDYFTTDYCLDCNHDGEPNNNVDMTVFNEKMNKDQNRDSKQEIESINEESHYEPMKLEIENPFNFN